MTDESQGGLSPRFDAVTAVDSAAAPCVQGRRRLLPKTACRLFLPVLFSGLTRKTGCKAHHPGSRITEIGPGGKRKPSARDRDG
jgi:hypothetical protein